MDLLPEESGAKVVVKVMRLATRNGKALEVADWKDATGPSLRSGNVSYVAGVAPLSCGARAGFSLGGERLGAPRNGFCGPAPFALP